MLTESMSQAMSSDNAVNMALVNRTGLQLKYSRPVGHRRWQRDTSFIKTTLTLINIQNRTSASRKHPECRPPHPSPPHMSQSLCVRRRGRPMTARKHPVHPNVAQTTLSPRDAQSRTFVLGSPQGIMLPFHSCPLQPPR